jgi:histidinol-phosphatase (PHP family)
MKLGNYHTHCHYCHGTGDPRSFLDAALEAGISSLGFSSHAPLPFPETWAMNHQDMPAYCRDINSLKQAAPDRIRVFLGLEIDFIPRLTGPGNPAFTRLPLDYCIGSVHFAGLRPDGRYWAVDGSSAEFEEGISSIFKGNIRKAVTEYYSILKKMIETEPPDIVGHFDLIKKNNGQNRYFSEESNWYRDAVDQVLAAVSASSCIVEVNTGGIARGFIDTVYPSPWIVRRCRERNIRICLGSDAHIPQTLAAHFEQAMLIIREAGYDAIQVLTPHGWESQSIS